MPLEFHEERHEYRLDGIILPSVTQVIAPLTKLWLTGAALEKARQEGKAIHKMVELHCRGTLDIDTLPEWLSPYLAAWESFLAFTGFRLVASEVPRGDTMLGFAGTFDLDGVLAKFPGSPAVLIDIKRSLAGAPAVGVQLAGYEALLGQPRRRFGLQLRDDGMYRLTEYDDKRDRAVFLACLTVTKWKERTK